MLSPWISEGGEVIASAAGGGGAIGGKGGEIAGGRCGDRRRGLACAYGRARARKKHAGKGLPSAARRVMCAP